MSFIRCYFVHWFTSVFFLDEQAAEQLAGVIWSNRNLDLIRCEKKKQKREYNNYCLDQDGQKFPFEWWPKNCVTVDIKEVNGLKITFSGSTTASHQSKNGISNRSVYHHFINTFHLPWKWQIFAINNNFLTKGYPNQSINPIFIVYWLLSFLFLIF